MTNVFEGIPYQDSGMGRRKLVDEKHLWIMQVALKPGQTVPQHDTNSNVHILCLAGELIINLAGNDVKITAGNLLPIAYKTPMNIRNTGAENATFLILKTPNPSEIEK